MAGENVILLKRALRVLVKRSMLAGVATWLTHSIGHGFEGVPVASLEAEIASRAISRMGAILTARSKVEKQYDARIEAPIEPSADNRVWLYSVLTNIADVPDSLYFVDRLSVPMGLRLPLLSPQVSFLNDSRSLMDDEDSTLAFMVSFTVSPDSSYYPAQQQRRIGPDLEIVR